MRFRHNLDPVNNKGLPHQCMHTIILDYTLLIQFVYIIPANNLRIVFSAEVNIMPTQHDLCRARLEEHTSSSPPPNTPIVVKGGGEMHTPNSYQSYTGIYSWWLCDCVGA